VWLDSERAFNIVGIKPRYKFYRAGNFYMRQMLGRRNKQLHTGMHAVCVCREELILKLRTRKMQSTFSGESLVRLSSRTRPAALKDRSLLALLAGITKILRFSGYLSLGLDTRGRRFAPMTVRVVTAVRPFLKLGVGQCKREPYWNRNG